MFKLASTHILKIKYFSAFVTPLNILESNICLKWYKLGKIYETNINYISKNLPHVLN